MKLRLPSLLLSALVAVQMSTTANADIVGSGVSYDVGKLSYSSDPTIKNSNDSLYCWAAAGANLLQYWQDTYLKFSNNPSITPNGLATSDTYKSPEGTNYLNIYQTVVNLGNADKTGGHDDLYKWWFAGTEYSRGGEVVLPNQKGGYYTNIFGKDASAAINTNVSRSKDVFADNLATVFKMQGQMPGFNLIVLHADNPDIMNAVTFHAISCWGYETTRIDGKDVVTSLILSDSDDKYFGAFRVNVTYESNPTLGNITIVSTDDENSYYGQNYLAYLSSMTYFDTPESYTVEGETVNVAKAAEGAGKLGSDHNLLSNTSLTEATTIEGDNLTVGDGEQIVILTSSVAEKLTLNGTDDTDKEAGLDVKAGSLVSLKNVSVSGYTDGGMLLDGHGYFDNGSLEIADNTKQGNGAGAQNEHYMEVKSNETVTISGNSATGNGGGIANDENATLSISGNGTVSFSNNTAAKGKDIYNATGATALIVNNEEVTFASGKSAVTNDGALYLGNTTDQKITFEDSTLDGSGTTYIGQDIRKNNYDGAVDFTKGKQTTSIKANKSGTAAALDNLKVSAGEIVGTSAKASSVTGANIVSNGNLLMKSLTLDASDTIATTSGAVNMTNTVIKLKDFASTTTTENGIKTYSFNLEGLVTSGTLTLNNVVFDTAGMSDLNIGENDSVLITFAPTVALTDAQLSKTEGTNLRGELQGTNAVIFNGGNLAPEPATATLSLLALAALATRRKRR